VVKDATIAARASLDAAEQLPVGTGKVDLFSFVKSEGGRTLAGGAVDYQHRIRRNLSAFGRAWVGASWDPRAGRSLEGEATAGIRLTW
jgi:hypothetical protein